MDSISKKKRSQIMRAIKGKHTGPERRLKAALARARLSGFECQAADLPGKPDFIYRFDRIAIFVNGDFFHGCPLHYKTPKSNRKFWMDKIRNNISRDIANDEKLRLIGWSVLQFWECEIKTRLPTIVETIKVCRG